MAQLQSRVCCDDATQAVMKDCLTGQTLATQRQYVVMIARSVQILLNCRISV
jgi:hypothetical protein